MSDGIKRSQRQFWLEGLRCQSCCFQGTLPTSSKIISSWGLQILIDWVAELVEIRHTFSIESTGIRKGWRIFFVVVVVVAVVVARQQYLVARAYLVKGDDICQSGRLSVLAHLLASKDTGVNLRISGKGFTYKWGIVCYVAVSFNLFFAANIYHYY